MVNGRLAMLGFVAGAAAEMNSGQTALSQFTDSHWAFIIATAHIMLASYIPIINGEKSAAPETMEEGMWKASSELQKCVARARTDACALALARCWSRGGAGLPAYAPTPSYDTRAGVDALTGSMHALSFSPPSPFLSHTPSPPRAAAAPPWSA